MANRDIYTIRKAGVTSSAPVPIYDIDKDAMIRIYPSAAGTATVYSSGSRKDLIDADITAGNAAITGNTNARWTQWASGAVTADTVQQALMYQKAVAVVVTSGTWVLEVSQ